MNEDTITETFRATLAGTVSFPQAVAAYVAAGVEYYHVDYIRLRTRFYSATGEMLGRSMDFEDLPPVAAELDKAKLRDAILDSQRNGQSYRDFTKRAMGSGVQGYYAFLRGERVMYLGRTGDQHTEWFPRRQRASQET